MKGDDDGLEEDDVLLAQRDREAADDGRQDVQQLGRPVELVVLVYQRQERVVNSLSDHLATRDQLGIQLVQDVLQIVALVVLLRVEQFQELHSFGIHRTPWMNCGVM